MPKNEMGKSRLKINKIGFGYQKVGGDFFGNPGASATCNINVLCPEGNDWQNERNSVALIVSGVTEICTGTLVMNTCGTSIPYLLTANHRLNSNVQNWVFQFQTWSNTCVPNGGFREDIQFNGCQLRANNAATDFALVELNQIPQPNSGLNYSGWSRNNLPTTSTSLHHPMGDLMKVSRDFQAAISVPWQGGANNHWRATFDQGIVQHGSSGAALFDQNHRVVGQLHGNQANQCLPGQNNCWCVTQIPSIGEYGRFDFSWAGGGTNATRLSNWLDPSNSGALTTNTTNTLNLATPTASLTISGDGYFCTTSNPYFLPNIAAGSIVVWSANPTNIVSINTPNSQQTTLTKIANGIITLTATVTNGCGTGGDIVITKPNIVIGTVITGSYLNPNFSSGVLHSGQSVCAGTIKVSLNEEQATTFSWQRVYGSAPFIDNGANIDITLTPNENVTFEITASNSCGSSGRTVNFIADDPQCGSGGGFFTFSVSPNPVKGSMNVIFDKPVKADENIKMRLYAINNFTIVKQWNLQGGQKQYSLNKSGVKSGHYILEAAIGTSKMSKQVIIE